MLTPQEGPCSMDLVPDMIVAVENSALVPLLHKNIREKLYEQRKSQLSSWNHIYNQEMNNKLR
jgi:hypothetical protein